MNTSPSLQERLKAQRAEQRRQDRLARLRAQRAEQARAEERRQELRRLAARQAQDERTAQTKKEAMIEQLLAQLRDGRKMEARSIDQRNAAQEAKRKQRLVTGREQQRQENKAVQQQTAQKNDSQAAQREQTRAAERARQVQRQAARREDRRDEQRASQQQEQQRENQVAQKRDQRRQQQQDEARRAGPSDQQQGQQADARAAQRRDDQRQEGRQRDRDTQRQADRQQARLDDQRAQQRQERADETRASQLQDNRREQRQTADGARQRAEALRVQEVERRRGDRQTLAANQQRRSNLRAAAGSARAQQAIADRASETLLWLRTQKNCVIGENEHRMDLRGVNVVGLDEVLLKPGQTLREALALDQRGLAILTDLWGANIVRVPFHPQTVLAGNGSLSANALLAELDELVSALAGAGAYTLLALQAPTTAVTTPLPDTDTFRCWRLLATHYQDEPAVLYEIYSASSPFSAGWPEAANQLIGEIRREHPASLIFVSGAGAGADTSGLPLRFATGDPVHDLVYTVRFTPLRSPARNDPQFRSFAQSYPVFASEWSDSGLDLGRSSETVGQLLERYGIGWTALNWNAEPGLVRDAAAHQFTATRFGNIIRRALTLPVKPQVVPFPRF